MWVNEADINLTLTLRDDDTGAEVVQKVHIYGRDENVVLRSMSRAAFDLLVMQGLIEQKETPDDGEERPRP